MINRDVPPKNIANPSFTPDSLAIAGTIAMIARNNDPGNVILDTTLSMCEAVSSPGRTPGIKTPLYFKSSAHLLGLIMSAV